jgi:hypothetical protein
MSIIIGLLVLWFLMWAMGKVLTSLHVAFAPRKEVALLRSKPELMLEWLDADDPEQTLREVCLMFPHLSEERSAAALAKAADLVLQDMRSDLAKERLRRHGIEV